MEVASSGPIEWFLRALAGAAGRALIALGAVLVCATGAHAQQPAGERASTIVILDGSNSMNARLPNDRSFKFVTVRDALRASLSQFGPGNEIGLAAFGARRASDCRDAEVVVPPSADGSRLLGALESFQPRGFSPVVLALRTAAAALPRDVAKASLVLVLDDLASCRGEDPCAVATELKRQNPALAIHVVALAPRPVDTPVLACVARQTGGQMISVADGPGVGPAVEQALALASAERRGPPPRLAAAVEKPAHATVVPRTPPVAMPGIDTSRPGLHLSARLADGKPPLTVPIQWRIRRVDPPRLTDTGTTIQRGDAEPLVEETAPALSRQLPSGLYEITANAGLVTASRQVEITSPSATVAMLDLDASLLSLTAPQAKGAQPPLDATLTVMSIGGGSSGSEAGTVLWIGRTGEHELVVPAGSYRVRARAGLVQAERVVTVGRGVAANVELPLSAGRLVLEERSSPEGEIGPPQLVVEADDPDQPGGRRELYRASAGRLELTMPAGTYAVTLRRGAAETRERVQVRPGETVGRLLTLGSVRVRLIARLGQGTPQGLPVSYRVERLDIASPVAQRWSETEAVIDLSPGRYRMEARIGEQNAVVVREVELRGGPGEARIEFDTGAGRIELRLARADDGHALGDVFWQIFDERGQSIWRTGQARPSLALVAGRYRARADLRDRAIEHVFDVRTGDSRVIEVGG